MKKIADFSFPFIFWAVLAAALAGPVFGQDFPVELMEEHYREKAVVGNGQPQIFHSFQVKSKFGTKLLILTGNNYNYRKYLRKTLDHHKLFLIKIPPAGVKQFTYNKVVYLNITQINPVYEKIWRCQQCRLGPPPPEKDSVENMTF